MNLSLHFPFNRTSLGQCSHGIARELFKKGINLPIFHVGQPDHGMLTAEDEEFVKWIVQNSIRAEEKHNRDTPTVKLWHIQGSLESFSSSPYLYTFYELDSPTARELNILKNQKGVMMPSKHYADLFASFGVNCTAIPLAFDRSFHRIDVKYPDDRICFGLAGKLEKRKHHLKVLKAWAKKYGNRHDVFLNCAIYNNFMKPEDQSNMIGQALEGQRYFNINFLPWMEKNEDYNKFLNANHIILAMSGGESWGLPEFTSTALGKHCVGLRAHGYKDWMNDNNAVCITPSGKLPAYDNMFFVEGHPFNQGNIFDFSEDEFIDACELAIKKYQENPINKNGLELQNQFTWEKTANAILETAK